MQREAPFLNNEIYHIYNRGAHKADVFLGEDDYARFQLLLFLGNHAGKPFRFDDLVRKYKAKGLPQGPSLRKAVFQEEKPDQELVDVLGYVLMPNHFHLILRQRSENGVTQFMKKVGTAHSMYFNTRHEHSGTVFQGKFKGKHVDSGEYLRWLFAYVALNPLDLMFPKWEEVGVEPTVAFKFLKTYQHASFPDMDEESKRPEQVILSKEALGEVVSDVPDLSNMSELFGIQKSGMV